LCIQTRPAGKYSRPNSFLAQRRKGAKAAKTQRILSNAAALCDFAPLREKSFPLTGITWQGSAVFVLADMSCEQTDELIHAYIDGELGLLRNVGIERHLGECEACRLKHRDELNLRSLIKSGAQYFAAPDTLKTPSQAADHSIETRTKSRPWVAAAAALILTLCGLLLWSIISARSTTPTDELIAQEIVSSHVRSLMLDHLIDVPASDTHTVKPWFNGKLDFAPEVKDLSEQGFSLIGGRLDYVDNRTVAALVYQRRKHPINLFIWPSAGAVDERGRQFSRQGYNVVYWTSSGMCYWAVSDVNNTDLQEFVQLERR
jgi:anti-sigma factor RsiW